MSTSREITLSVQPPKNPASKPSSEPNRQAAVLATMATIRAGRVA
jgi:hypothetical protein